jgi:hypothetical protein
MIVLVPDLIRYVLNILSLFEEADDSSLGGVYVVKEVLTARPLLLPFEFCRLHFLKLSNQTEQVYLWAYEFLVDVPQFAIFSIVI